MKTLVATLMIALMAFAGVPEAFAKAGSGKSYGSRGSRTNDRPMERTVTPPAQVAPSPQAPAGAPMYNPGAVRQPSAMAPSAAMAQPSFFQRNPFVTGMLGGLVGAGIGSMLFGHSPALAAASTAAPGASMLGMLLQVALIGGGIYLLYRLFRRRQEAGVPQAGYQRTAYEQPMEALPASQSQRVEKEFEASEADQQAFGDILMGVQKAWSSGDVVKLRSLATPEVASWLAEDLARNASQGIVNTVENVTLLKGDIVESWREGDLDYATAALTFSAIDTTVKADTGSLVEGDPKTPAESTEAWTFVRNNGGRWLLSAVERE
jgi:predicted lipid-binding transport protein (Tim44 family)